MANAGRRAVLQDGAVTSATVPTGTGLTFDLLKSLFAYASANRHRYL